MPGGDAESGSRAQAELPMERVHRSLAEARRVAGGEPAAGDLARRAQALGLSTARLREMAAFFPQLGRPAEARVCVGTSCWLRGGDEVAAALPAAQRVHCLGHCDRSPCFADARGEVHAGVPAARALGSGSAEAIASVPRPEVRCAAPEPIVTRHLVGGDVPSLTAARERGVYDALLAALRESPRRVLAEVERSDERGRGGAGFPTGAKWRAAAAAPGPRVVVANGDEGDPGSYVDRMLLEEDPHTVLEGLALCAFAVGAEEGVLFIRSEYPRALRRMREAVAEAEVEGLVGANAARPFRVRVASGFGSYVGGEETALLETLEGRAGEVRLRPPYPVERGLLGRPTVVNNVETLAVIPWIVTHGGDAYRRLGTAASSGTKALCLNAGFRRPGIVEIELGRSLRSVIEGEGGTRPEELEAILLGGPMGSLLFEDEWDVPLCYEALAQRGVRLGHGGLVAVPRGIDWRTWLVQGLEFMARESCGKCVPCREGSRRARDAVGAGACSGETLDALLACIEQTSLCGFGRGAPGPLRKLVARRPDAVTS